MARKEKKQSKNKLKPINLDFSKIEKDFKIIEKPKQKEEKREEKTSEQLIEETELQEEFGEDQNFSPRFRSDFSTQFKAPVLESSQDSLANLETGVQDIQTSSTIQTPQAAQEARENITETREVVYVQNAPKYTADYNFRSYEANGDFDDSQTQARRDVQEDITQGRLMHRVPVLETKQEMNLGTWQREHVFDQQRGESNFQRAERDYQIAGAREKKSKDKLPFQE
jgi:hypothetical protein